MQKQSFDRIKTEKSEVKTGRGLIDGNGFTNGLSSGATPRDHVKSKVEGTSKPDPNTYNNGLTNGNGFTVGNGMTNGNGVNGKPNRIPLVKSKQFRKRVLGIAVAVVMLIAPLALYMVDFEETDRGIVIDGDFKDWNGVYRHSDSATDMIDRPNVNIMETSMIVDEDEALLLLTVEGYILQGDNNEMADQVFIFLDSDTDAGTGYQYQGIGAEYMVVAYGSMNILHYSRIYTFDNNYMSTDKRINTDWNAWNPVDNGRVATGINKLEASVELYQGSFNEDRIMYAVFEVRDFTGSTDRTEIVSNSPGYLVIDQEPVAGDIIASGENENAVRLVATAYESPVVVDELYFTKSEGITLSTSLQLPITILPGESREIIVNADTSLVDSESVVEIKLTSASVLDIGGKDALNLPATITGKGYSGYADTIPSKIVIDGAFGDWNRVVGHSDERSEASVNGNSNIDIVEYRSVEAVESFSFYLRVDGTIFDGTKILSGPIRIIEEIVQGSSESSGQEPKSNSPANFGYDYAYIFLDTDGDKSTGYQDREAPGSEFLARLVGLNGKILYKELFRFNDGLISTDEIWVKVSNVLAASDAQQLETQILAWQLDLKGIETVDYYVKMTDWSKNTDRAEDPFIGVVGGSGIISIVKMDENFDHRDPQVSNSRNPMGTRASSRATYTGNQNGADLTLANNDILSGSIYNIRNFIIPAGVYVYIDPGVLCKISAMFIYINGTIVGIGNGTTGGTGGAAGNNPGAPGGGILAGGNGTGGTGENNNGGGGGGGGGYGGDGGSGGAGAGGTGAGGAGGPKFSNNQSESINMGFGGAGGGGGGGSVGGNGGGGGSGIFIHATDILVITGEITVNGSDGSTGGTAGNDGGGGGGGGSGGGIMLKLDHSTNALVLNGAKLYANGGNGGNGGSVAQDGGGGGGGGGGGQIKIFYNSSFTNTSTIEVNGGTGGAGGTGTGTGVTGTSGQNGSFYASTIPEFYTIAIPITLTMIVFFSLRKGRGRKSKVEGDTTKEVVL